MLALQVTRYEYRTAMSSKRSSVLVSNHSAQRRSGPSWIKRPLPTQRLTRCKMSGITRNSVHDVAGPKSIHLKGAYRLLHRRAPLQQLMQGWTRFLHLVSTQSQYWRSWDLTPVSFSVDIAVGLSKACKLKLDEGFYLPTSSCTI